MVGEREENSEKIGGKREEGRKKNIGNKSREE